MYHETDEELSNNEILNRKFDPVKADVFSLGLTLLFAATLKNVDGLNVEKELLERRLSYL